MDEEISADDSVSDEETPQRQIREQTNLKQKFARLLRRFKSSDDAEVNYIILYIMLYHMHIFNIFKQGHQLEPSYFYDLKQLAS